jgi:enterochelin esterase-like enzyme
MAIDMTETVHRLSSRILMNERNVWVRHAANEEFIENLVIVLDGELYREKVGAVPIVDRVHEKVGSTVFVFVSYASIEARWIECPCYPPFARFFEEEFFHWLEQHYPNLRNVRRRVIVGLSYTGLAAAFVATHISHRFTHVIAQSGSFWSQDGWLSRQISRLSYLHSQFYLEVGNQETQTNVQHKEDVLQVVSQIQGVREFRDALKSRRVPTQYSEYDGGHDFGWWARRLPQALMWALVDELPQNSSSGPA